MLRILCDVEGTLADTHSVFVRRLNERRGTNYTIEAIDDWGTSETMGKLPANTKEFHDSIIESWRLYIKGKIEMPPIEKNFAGKLEALHENHLLDIATGNHTCQSEIFSWLNTHRVLFRQYFCVRGSEAKYALFKDYDIFIDDNPNLAAEINKIDGKLLLLYDRPWNRKVVATNCVKRVHNLDEIVKNYCK